ncbi:MAG TPA: hypothetical protein DDW94_02545 [Deltaproteobacteria bacterium]|nr:MAG: hypothetical protein A2Z79_09295 [Deltaproteobacteria bacterium GWA2_55_82]OGQ64727.1 MAG: hypothetical protein A3I81_07715 [Deltaproteobacteria bacterium RIFCSPLOWO2_02_FULL_55_12]OIJ73756.1 MAG: hypothetical protein A2V21_305435 [Deltaproteobacteria bacterium GWC2_55_46]HBG45846.1 hypothetical protein [Deltaproteobacteria bacterium]HCY09735.1 hypothetical protein [Deltaproteobacteria bacterium]
MLARAVNKTTPIISSTAPSSPVVDDLWLDTNTSRANRVVFVGDSITAVDRSSYAEILKRNLPLDYPTQGWSIWNEAVGGTSTDDWVAWIASKITDHNPTIVTIMLGTNDSCQLVDRHVDIVDYEANLRTIISAIQPAGADIILLTPPPVDDTAENLIPDAYTNTQVQPYVQKVRDLAAELHIPYVDTYNILWGLSGSGDWKKVHVAQKDGVHLSRYGYGLMYHSLYTLINDIVANTTKRWDGYNWKAVTPPLPQYIELFIGGYKGEWDSTITYHIDDIVLYAGTYYMARIASLNAAPPNASYWFVTENPSGGGAAAFTDLTDAFSDYTGLGGRHLRVKTTEDGVEAVSDYVIDGASFLDSLSDFDRDIDGGTFI